MIKYIIHPCIPQPNLETKVRSAFDWCGQLSKWSAGVLSWSNGEVRVAAMVSHTAGGLYQLSHKGSPRILEWVAYPFSRGSSH